MSDFDVNTLISALDNDTNENLLDLDHNKISNIKNNVLQRLRLTPAKLRSLHKSLKFYRYVDELPDLNYGSYIRWIPLKDPEKIKLTNGGIVCVIKIVDNGIAVICKNRYNSMFQVLLNENLIFQKLTEQEQVILSAMDYLNE
jgi:hypothetical protein